MVHFARCSLVTVVLLGSGLQSVSAEPKKAPPTKEQIAEWVRELGDDEFQIRENATKNLWEAGRLAEDALAEVRESDDLEVRHRGGELLDKFKWGIYPDTIPELVVLIQQYRSSANVDDKAGVLAEMLSRGDDTQVIVDKFKAAEGDVFGELARPLSLQVDMSQMNLCIDKDYDAAIKLLDKAIRCCPDKKLFYWRRGQCWLEKKEYDRAIKDFDLAVAIHSDPWGPGAEQILASRAKAWNAKKDYEGTQGY